MTAGIKVDTRQGWLEHIVVRIYRFSSQTKYVPLDDGKEWFNVIAAIAI